jgi:diphosphomevalonate decarboxylase
MMDNFYSSPEKFIATAPSNIAFVKYWGKRDASLQWPANDSFSMTLSRSRTETIAQKTTDGTDSFTFEGVTFTSKCHPDHKVFRHINRVRKTLNISGSVSIQSKNTFPTGCGIASSASGFAALTLATIAVLTGETSWERLSLLGISRETIAHLARQGSGSAGRSLFGGFVVWKAGETPDSQILEEVFAPNEWDLSDIIVVFSDKEKHTSSSDAHLAAWGSPLFAARLAGLKARMEIIQNAIRKKDLELLGREIEADALEMHAVAMTGSPAVNYFCDNTIKFTAWVRAERDAGRLPAWFTIDAGPNVHLICPTHSVETIVTHLKSHWPDAQLIVDRVGQGPTLQRIVSQAASAEVNHV